MHSAANGIERTIRGLLSEWFPLISLSGCYGLFLNIQFCQLVACLIATEEAGSFWKVTKIKIREGSPVGNVHFKHISTSHPPLIEWEDKESDCPTKSREITYIPSTSSHSTVFMSHFIVYIFILFLGHSHSPSCWMEARGYIRSISETGSAHSFIQQTPFELWHVRYDWVDF